MSRHLQTTRATENPNLRTGPIHDHDRVRVRPGLMSGPMTGLAPAAPRIFFLVTGTAVAMDVS